jgi:glycerol kinase
LFNCIENKWDPELFSIFEIKKMALADIKPSASNFGVSNFENNFSKDIPITGVAGDAQASFFANLCLNIGDTKITTGTGFNIQTNIGTEFFTSGNSFTTLAFTHNNKNFYSLECLSSVAGATISWLKNNLQLIQSADESETLSNLVPDTGGVSLIPAFTGLGPPYWKENARAAFLGINASTKKYHLVRAALESIAFQIVVYLESLRESDELKLNSIIVDGGLIKNRLFLEMIADLLKIEIRVPIIEDMSLYGALLFGIQKQKNLSDLKTLHSFAVKQNTIRYKDNSKLSLSYQNWKNLINKHF